MIFTLSDKLFSSGIAEVFYDLSSKRGDMSYVNYINHPLSFQNDVVGLDDELRKWVLENGCKFVTVDHDNNVAKTRRLAVQCPDVETSILFKLTWL